VIEVEERPLCPFEEHSLAVTERTIDQERRVVYTGFSLAPRPGDAHEELDPEEIRRRRQALSDQVPNIERERIVSTEAFKLDA